MLEGTEGESDHLERFGVDHSPLFFSVVTLLSRQRRTMRKVEVTINRQTPFSELPELLRPKEATEWLNLGRNSIYEAIKSGELPHRRIGGCIFIPKSALMEVSVA